MGEAHSQIPESVGIYLGQQVAVEAGKAHWGVWLCPLQGLEQLLDASLHKAVKWLASPLFL